MEKIEYRKEFTSYPKRITLLWVAFIVCLVFVTTISLWLGSIVSDRVTLILVSSAVQNVCVFMLPAFLVAYFITKRPVAFLGLTNKVSWKQVAFVIGVVLLSMPMLNYLVSLNESIDLPDSALEDWLRNTEAAARAVTDELLKVDSFGTLVWTVLVAGVLTGLGEELFFRGAQQRIFMLRGINGHLAVWVTAIIFSILHFQFYGFFPRMLLGAFFGYLVWKGGSLWLPIIAHALNNTLAVVLGYMSQHDIAAALWLNSCGVPADGSFPLLATLSLLATVAFIVLCQRLLPGNNTTANIGK